MSVYKEMRAGKDGKARPYYYYSFRHNKRQVKGTAKGLAHIRAEVLRSEQRRREQLGKGIRISRTPLLSQFIDTVYLPWSKANKASYDTDVITCEQIKSFFKNERIADISVRRVKDFVQWRQGLKTQHKRDRTNSTVNREKSILSKILSLAVEDELIEINPALRVRPLKKAKPRMLYWTAAEEKKVMAQLIGDRAHLKPIIEVFLFTGMRQKELFQLTVERLDFENNLIHVRGFKTSTERIVAMEPNVRRILREVTLGRKGTDLIFPSYKTGLALTSIRKGLGKACFDAGVKNIGVHGLRHTRGTRLAMAGMNAFQIAAELGHSDVRQTQSYIHVREAKDRGKAESSKSFHKLSILKGNAR